LDAYVIASRWEGAPNSVLECAASKTKVVSTRVGQSPDILFRSQIFDDAAAGAHLLAKDMEDGFLGSAVEAAYERIHTFNTYPAIAGRLKYIYEQAQTNASPKRVGKPLTVQRSGLAAWFGGGRRSVTSPEREARRETIERRVGKKKILTFALWNDFQPPPYGGGNQFMIALEGALQRQGMTVIRNSGVGAGRPCDPIDLV